MSLWFFTGILLVFISSCSSPAVITGEIYPVPAGGEITLAYDDEIKIKPDSADHFSFLLHDVPREGSYVLLQTEMDISLFVRPGENLYVKIDEGKKQYAVKGKDTSLNQQIQALQQRLGLLGKEVEQKNLFREDIKHYVAFLDSALDLLEAPVNAPDKFIRYEEERIGWFRKQMLWRYPFSHALVRREKYTWPDSLKGIFPDISFTDPSWLVFPEFRSFLSVWLDMEAKYRIENEPPRYEDFCFTRMKMDIARNGIKEMRIRNYALKKIMQDHLVQFGPYHADTLLSMFDSYCTHAGYRKEIDSLYDAVLRRNNDHLVMPYKKIKNIVLDAHVFLPSDEGDELHPAVCFYFGGGWYEGTPEVFFDFCRFFARHGYVAVSFDYRTKGRFNTTPVEALQDARSALRWIRSMAGKWKIDPSRVAACGWSAGGHLAACTAIIPGYDDPCDTLSQRATPDAIVLNASCVMPEEDNWFYYVSQYVMDPKLLSPYARLHKNIPPVLILHGTADEYVPVWTVKKFEQKIREKHAMVVSLIKEGARHRDFRNEYYAGVILDFLNRAMKKTPVRR